MVTPQEIRRIRLATDYERMCSIQGDIIRWIPTKGELPYVEEYRVIIHVRTIIGVSGDEPVYRDASVVTVSLCTEYPFQCPKIIMESTPPPFHVDWYVNGLWSCGRWFMSESLADFVIRMVRSLQFDPDITNELSPSNIDAKEWYVANKRSGLFPCDSQRLPDPTVSNSAHSGQRSFVIKRKGGTF